MYISTAYIFIVAVLLSTGLAIFICLGFIIKWAVIWLYEKFRKLRSWLKHG